MSALLVALALAVQPVHETPPPAAAEETEVSELLVIARRQAPDPSAVTTECVWRNLPPDERSALTQEAGLAMRSLGGASPHRVNRAVVTPAGVAVALTACGAPAEEEALPFARTAVVFYAGERAAAEALGARGIAAPRLDGAWEGLSPDARETLTGQAGRMAGGAKLRESEGEAMAMIAFGLIRRLRPLSAFNPLAYRNGSMNHLIVAHYAPRAVRTAMERRF